VDVRVVAATHRALDERIASGLFRQDLLFRLNVLPITLPPLRERPADIVLLACQFLSHSLKDMEWEGAVPRFSTDSIDMLNTYPWPGNVRELRNLTTRLAVRLPSGLREISPQLLRPLMPNSGRRSAVEERGVFVPAGTSLEEAEWLLIDAALKQSQYNRTQAAKLLGIGERTLRRKLNQS
jgi:DNA-binding NtrC family response regulator